MPQATSEAIEQREMKERLGSLEDRPNLSRHTFWFSGDGLNTNFDLPNGWVVKSVFVDGRLVRPGAGEDYTAAVSNKVVFFVAPPAVDVAIEGEVRA